MTKATYRGRFAPSPTGLLHLGSARTALVAWARARSEHGAIVLRIEDLDPPRVVPGATDAIVNDLGWLGLDFDHDPLSVPNHQSARTDHYVAALERLVASQLTYPCSCSRKEVQSVASAPHGPDDDGPRYPGTCRAGPTHPERVPAWRFRMPVPSPGFVDALAGPIAEGAWDPGDFVVRRADGVFAYQLAVIVDDLAMGITEVVRGDDLLSSTPRQIALARALDAEPPRYLHVPLVLDAHGERLGKRHGSTSIAALRDSGLTAEEVVGRLAATLGLAAPDERLSAREVATRFDLAALPRMPTRWSGA